VIVAAVSSARPDRVYPFQVPLRAPEGGLTRDSKVLLDQIRTVDKSRLGDRLGALTPERMAEVDKAILISLGVRVGR
jgi:mRNA interferase MazF